MTELATPPAAASIAPESRYYNARLIRREDLTESLAFIWVKFAGDPMRFEPAQYLDIWVGTKRTPAVPDCYGWGMSTPAARGSLPFGQ